METSIKVEDVGFHQSFDEYRRENGLEDFLPGRVITEHRERYTVLTEEGELEAELIGNMRYTAASRADLPAVGDWVAVNKYEEGKGLIHAVYPRYSTLERQAVGQGGEKQIIATNIDYGLIIQAVNRDFNINRLERYRAICSASSITPIIVLSKTDLQDDATTEAMLNDIKERIQGVAIIPLSNLSTDGVEAVRSLIGKGKTYCLLGSSGVGKSTLLNNLAQEAVMSTGEISASVDKGKHVTTHRELIVLPSGGILIDNPGMREVGITEHSEGLEATFDSIYQLANNCRFNDCSHQDEKGCAVIEALAQGELNDETYKNFMKLAREQAHFSAAVHERRRKEKAFGKMIKEVVQRKNKGKY